MPKRAPRGHCPACIARPPITRGVLARHWPPGSSPGDPHCPGSRQPPADPPPAGPAQAPDSLLTVFAARRQELGLLQADVAEAAGVSRTYYGQVERGERSTSLVTVRGVCDVLRLRLDATPVEEHAAAARDAAAVRAQNRLLTARANAAEARAKQLAVENAALARRLQEAQRSAGNAYTEAALTRALAALDAMARQPVITHDLVDRARDAILAHRPGQPTDSRRAAA